MSEKPGKSAQDETVELIRSPGQDPIPRVLPVLPLNDVVVFPGMIAPLIVSTARSIRLIDDVVAGSRFMMGLLQRDRATPDDRVGLEDLHERGTVLRLLKMLKFPDETVRVLVQGVSRCMRTHAEPGGPYLRAYHAIVKDEQEESIELTALSRNASQAFQEIITMSPALPEELKIAVVNVDDPGRLSDLIAANLNVGLEDRQGLIAEPSPVARLRKLTALLNREREVLRLGSEIQSQVSENFSKTQREYFLREQLKAIRKELGEHDQHQGELRDIEDKIARARMPPDVLKQVAKEKDRLASIPSASPEHGVVRTYIELMADLPWSVLTEDHLDIARARRILDEDHDDLAKIKDRILEYLSVLKLKKDMKGPILCFQGPPGVGKTSLGQSIARALGRKFVRISLGGMRDEAEIRGHRRTYIGAMPGRIVQSLRKCGSRNPVFMLDEIDKLGSDFRGDPASALLEVLDPAQNNSFTDHYVDAPFDLSAVMFIATANVLDTIPPPLRDRMEILELPGYTLLEKLQIAKRYLVPKQVEAHGLKPRHVAFADAALEGIAVDYTREAGVRNLDREIASICRKVARRVAEGRGRATKVGRKDLRSFLGPVRFESEAAEKRADPGIATGLAWTPTGGDILFIEATRMPGKGNLILTGSLGDVMKESAKAALSYVRAHADRWKLPEKLAEQNDFHIHVPAGAIPKDGPSAGLAILAALFSLVTGRPIPSSVAMTGEITLRGRVMPVGGIKEKVLAASRAGIKRVVLSSNNRRHLEEIPPEVRRKMDFKFVSRAEDALKYLTNGSAAAGKRAKGARA